MSRTASLFILIGVCLLWWGQGARADQVWIEGRVVDSETGEPLPFVNIILEGGAGGAATDLDGYYRIYGVTAGIYRVTARMLSYADLTVTDVVVTSGEITRLDFSLTPEAIQMDPIVVEAARVRSTVSALLNSQKKSAVISSGVSAEQISRSPDSRASDALKRVTGLSVVNDKHVFVRGLSERYSNARLNGSSLPSPEPDKRSVPFDIFPSNLLSNIVITKSFLPSLPGDFAGGCIQLTTKEFTENLIAKLSTSYGFNTQTTFQDFQTYRGGRLDFLGIDDGTRDLPGRVEHVSGTQKIVEGGQFGGGFSAEQIESFGESFRNVWSPRNRKAPVNQSYSIAAGNQTSLLGRPLGIIASLTYKNTYSFHEEERLYYINGAHGLESRHHYQDFKISNMNILWGGVFNTSYKLSPGHKVGVKTTYTRTADDEVRTYGMFPNRDHNLDELATRLRWVERSLISTELSGDHQLRFLRSKLDWRSTLSLATRKEPDTRETLYESDIGLNSYRLADESNSGSRFFSDLSDRNLDISLNWEAPFQQWNSLPAKFKMGAGLIRKDREFDSRRFRFKPQDFNKVNIYQEPESIFSPENIHDDGFQLEEDTRATDNYEANQTVGAGYAMVDMPLSIRTRLVAGARLERSEQEVTTFDLFNPNASPIVGQVKTTDLLPSLNLTYQLRQDSNLRLGLSRTVSRPSFRELSQFEFTDVGGHAVVGNPELKRAHILNCDLRWEWYPDLGENVSVALLYKYFNDPIEQTLLNATELTTSWQNAKNAYTYGLELEARKRLELLHPALSGFTMTGNVALIRSSVELYPRGLETSKERALQGQSPYVINVMLEYKHSRIGYELSVMYNVFGPRIAEVGIAGTPDIYEEPFHKLDLVLSQSVWKGVRMKLSAGNLLDPEVRFTQGDKDQRFYRKGRAFSLGMSYSL
jgi:outer membrane receptor protein involved in Fe transport